MVDRTIDVVTSTDLPPSVSAWVEDAAGRAIDQTERLLGGTSAEVHRVSCGSESFVVRQITNREWLAREPDLIKQERTALDLCADSPVPAPAHVASDDAAGLLLMTMLGGEVRTAAEDVADGATALGEMAARISAIELPDDHGLHGWRSWVPAELVPTDWGDRALWEEAIAAFRGRDAPTAEPPVLLHRDLHPLNVLWVDGEISGIVDWVNTCVGHPHADLAHCRWNLHTLAGPEAATALLAGRDAEDYDPWWDICAVMGTQSSPTDVTAWNALGRTDLTVRRVNESAEAFLRAAVEAL